MGEIERIRDTTPVTYRRTDGESPHRQPKDRDKDEPVDTVELHEEPVPAEGPNADSDDDAGGLDIRR